MICYSLLGQKQRVKKAFILESQWGDCAGTRETITKPCSHCSGTGKARKRSSIKVDIPKGVQEGDVIKVKGKGNAGEFGGTPGDLHVEIKVRFPPLFPLAILPDSVCLLLRSQNIPCSAERIETSILISCWIYPKPSWEVQ